MNGYSMISILEGQRPSDPVVLIDRCGRFQARLQPNEDTEAMIRRTTSGDLHIGLRDEDVNNGVTFPLHRSTGSAKEALQVIAGYLFFGIE